MCGACKLTGTLATFAVLGPSCAPTQYMCGTCKLTGTLATFAVLGPSCAPTHN